MKRTADVAFPAGSEGAGPAVFQPSGAAMLDPKAYFAQWQNQAAAVGQAPLPIAPAVGSGAAAIEKTELYKQVESVSAIKCAAIVKEKGHNFTPMVAIQALNTMAAKSSYKLREELLKQPHVKWLCTRIQEIVKQPPHGVGLEQLAAAVWSLTRFPNEGRGEPTVTLGATARVLGSLQGPSWKADAASKVLWSLAKGEVINQHKTVVSQVVQELVRDKGRRVAELSHEGLENLLWAVAKARKHVQKGDHQTVHVEANDELLFAMASKRIQAEVEQMDVRLLAAVAHTHAEIGIKDEVLFKAMTPRIVAKSKDLDEKTMGKCIKAYRMFMLPLKEEQQGFRTMAVVQKGDFIRPSDKPKKTGKRVYDHPQSLYPKTPIFGRA